MLTALSAGNFAVRDFDRGRKFLLDRRDCSALPLSFPADPYGLSMFSHTSFENRQAMPVPFWSSPTGAIGRCRKYRTLLFPTPEGRLAHLGGSCGI